MTDHLSHQSESPDSDASAAEPLDAWMLALARDVANDVSHDVTVPRELMWKRVQHVRAEARALETRQQNAIATYSGKPSAGEPSLPVVAAASTSVTHEPSRVRTRWRTAAGIAAVLLGGIAIGRYALPQVRDAVGTRIVSSADSVTMPARVAMDEHLVRTASLLTAVRDRDGTVAMGQDMSTWARELLATTRLMLDDPSLRDQRTHALLQDLELVLMQIAQSRGTEAPEARRAPTETMRETNLLPRVRAAVQAASQHEPLLRGAAE